MEEILKQILEELQFHTKLLESMVENRDENRFNAEKTQASMTEAITMMQKETLNHPSIKNNPETMKLVSNMLNMIPKSRTGG